VRQSDRQWRIEVRDGVRLVRCAALERLPRVRHAFSTGRATDGTRFDLGDHDDVAAAVKRRRGEFLNASGLGGRRPTLLHQVHRSAIIEVADHEPGTAADGAVSFAAGSHTWVPAVRWADCVPLLLAAPDGSAVAAVHAGWRGTVAGIAPRAVDRLREGGIRPAGLIAALGPAIGACCFEVGEEVAVAVARAVDAEPGQVDRRERGRLTLDLRLAIRLQLEAAGLEGDQIHVAPWCSACASDLFFSHRRDGARAGRQMACIGWPEPGQP
jgi:YfiH family protein